MQAELHPSSRLPRLAGAATTLTVLALLTLAFSRPAAQTIDEPAVDAITFAAVERNVAPDIPPVMLLQNIDLPTPAVMISLPAFDRAVVSPALPSLAPVSSPEASPAPSGRVGVAHGRPDGTGRTHGAGSSLIPPVRAITDDAPFDLGTSTRSGLVTSLDFCVTDQGRTRHVRLATSSGFRDMDATAIEWLERQRFKPGTLDGVPVNMCATYDIRWTNSKASPFDARTAAAAHAAAIRKRSQYPRQFVHWPQAGPFPGCDAVTLCKQTIQ